MKFFTENHVFSSPAVSDLQAIRIILKYNIQDRKIFLKTQIYSPIIALTGFSNGPAFCSQWSSSRDNSWPFEVYHDPECVARRTTIVASSKKKRRKNRKYFKFNIFLINFTKYGITPFECLLVTPPRTPRISRLKSQILKPTFLS